jgi:hypothetical protein
MHENTGLLIREPRLILSVEQSLASVPGLKNLPVIHPTLLREGRIYSQLIVIGPSRWYPDYVFSSPRAPKILIVKFSWIKDHWKQEPIFSEPIKQKATKKQKIEFEDRSEDSALSPEDLLPPTFDIEGIARTAAGELNTSGDQDYGVNARVYLFEGGWGVFLEADETASVLVIDLGNERGIPVRRIKIGQLEPGMFILLRTAGGGDYIIPVADQIMGDNAAIAREFQKEWKTKLQKKVTRLGYGPVVSQLKNLGSGCASQINVHHWMSMRSIKTGDKVDFVAIMRLIGLENDIDYYWDMMRLIDNAHLRAGQLIRRMLLEQVRASDLSILKRTGRMDFTLPGKRSISITAFQLNEMSAKVITVPHWRIGVPFDTGE